MRNRLTRWRERLDAFARTDRGRLTLKAGRLLFVAAVVTLLAYQLTTIGWRDVLTSLPTTPWFYVIYGMLYFLLPVFEAGIYHRLWRLPVRALFPVLIRKRVLNNDVVGYSGEVYLYLWARKRLAGGERFAFHSIKDNAIASSVASTAALILLVGGFLLTGQVALVDLIGNRDPLYIAFGLVALGVLAALGLRFRKTIFTLPIRTVLLLAGIHLMRFLLMYTLQVVQWWVVLPEAPLRVWATILVVGTLMSRIPLVPARDLLSLGAMLGVSGLLDASQAVIAGMLVVRSGLDKLLNVGLFTLTAWWDRRHGRPLPDPEITPQHPAAEPMPEWEGADS
ncbi:MAG: hypothetical protein D6685_15525 [Bacteroidetes bacterium]|nr:hypothetical protein AWN76_012635 [Rhodothermaceae bacterium RA]RMH53640.1 MAG: hypothetical protein D6685_15525 [Bacteroidota bacterium]